MRTRSNSLVLLLCSETFYLYDDESFLADLYEIEREIDVVHIVENQDRSTPREAGRRS